MKVKFWNALMLAAKKVGMIFDHIELWAWNHWLGAKLEEKEEKEKEEFRARLTKTEFLVPPIKEQRSDKELRELMEQMEQIEENYQTNRTTEQS